ncbi:hypothetical protein [Pseudomonas phage PPAY]|nr:hypothetical protein [Pseudomonas phage PPAY]
MLTTTMANPRHSVGYDVFMIIIVIPNIIFDIYVANFNRKFIPIPMNNIYFSSYRDRTLPTVPFNPFITGASFR